MFTLWYSFSVATIGSPTTTFLLLNVSLRNRLSSEISDADTCPEDDGADCPGWAEAPWDTTEMLTGSVEYVLPLTVTDAPGIEKVPVFLGVMM